LIIVADGHSATPLDGLKRRPVEVFVYGGKLNFQPTQKESRGRSESNATCGSVLMGRLVSLDETIARIAPVPVARNKRRHEPYATRFSSAAILLRRAPCGAHHIIMPVTNNAGGNRPTRNQSIRSASPPHSP
jgi:hypothetical protein